MLMFYEGRLTVSYLGISRSLAAAPARTQSRSVALQRSDRYTAEPDARPRPQTDRNCAPPAHSVKIDITS